jgi:VIT1/CCC1 family predicted Fe2+/Mn2+ transporter
VKRLSTAVPIVGEIMCGTVLAPRQAMLMIILLVVLVLAVVGAVPAWPHSRSWGYYPSSGLGLVLVVLLILYLLGYLRF